MCFPSKREMEGELWLPLCCRVERSFLLCAAALSWCQLGGGLVSLLNGYGGSALYLPLLTPGMGKWNADGLQLTPSCSVLLMPFEAAGSASPWFLLTMGMCHVLCVVCVCVGGWSVVVANPVSHSFVKSVCSWVVEVAQLALDTIGTTLNGWIWAPLASTGCQVWKTSFLFSLATNPPGFFESTSTSSWTWKISFLPSFIYTVLVGKELQHPCEWNRRSVAFFVLLIIVGLTACLPYSGWEEGAYGRFSCGLGPTETGRVHVHVCVCVSFVEGLWLEYGGYYWKGFYW